MVESIAKPEATSRVVAASIAMVLATPVLIWWLIGDVSEPGGTDYIIRPPTIGPLLGALLGWGSSLMFAGASYTLWKDGRPLLVQQGYWRVLVRLVAVGVLFAAGARIITSAVGGAHIGGAGIMMTGPLVLLYLLARARQEWVRAAAEDGAAGWMPSAWEWAWAGVRCGGNYAKLVISGLVLLVVIPAAGVLLVLWCPTVRTLSAVRRRMMA